MLPGSSAWDPQEESNATLSTAVFKAIFTSDVISIDQFVLRIRKLIRVKRAEIKKKLKTMIKKLKDTQSNKNKVKTRITILERKFTGFGN